MLWVGPDPVPSRAHRGLIHVVSMFYGIIIRIHPLNGGHRHLPHIRAKYAESEASVGIDEEEIYRQEACPGSSRDWFGSE